MKEYLVYEDDFPATARRVRAKTLSEACDVYCKLYRCPESLVSVWEYECIPVIEVPVQASLRKVHSGLVELNMEGKEGVVLSEFASQEIREWMNK